MEKLEERFDVLTRKRTPSRNKNGLHEVDEAFFAKGIPEEKMIITKNHGLSIEKSSSGDRVFAIGHKGAIDFQGGYSVGAGERYYGVVYKKRFIKHYGDDLRIAGDAGKSLHTPSATNFAQTSATKNKTFVIRSENSTRTQGQVHVQFKEGYDMMDIDGNLTTQKDWLNKHVQGVVEFDKDGKIIRFIETAD